MNKPIPKPSAAVEEMLAAAGLDPVQRIPARPKPSPRYQALLQALLRRDRARAG